MSHQSWIWGIHCTPWGTRQMRNPPWVWNRGQTSPVQNRGISGRYPLKLKKKQTLHLFSSLVHLSIERENVQNGHGGGGRKGVLSIGVLNLQQSYIIFVLENLDYAVSIVKHAPGPIHNWKDFIWSQAKWSKSLEYFCSVVLHSVYTSFSG